jgi:hypothetical protein
VLAGATGLIGGLVHQWQTGSEVPKMSTVWISGASLGGVTAGLTAAAAWFRPSLAPSWGDFSSLGTFLPLADMAADAWSGYLQLALYGSLLFAFVHKLSGQWSRKRILAGFSLFLFGFAVAGGKGIEVISAWLAAGAIMGIVLLAVYLLVLRYCMPALFPGLALLQSLALLKHSVQSPMHLGMAGHLAGIAGIWLISACLVRRFSPRTVSGADTA